LSRGSPRLRTSVHLDRRLSDQRLVPDRIPAIDLLRLLPTIAIATHMSARTIVGVPGRFTARVNMCVAVERRQYYSRAQVLIVDAV
jgi:hypothetical protein